RLGDHHHRCPRARHPQHSRPRTHLRRQRRRLMSALLRMRAGRDQMSAIERRIADFILDNAQLLRDYSSQQLANALRISQSSVVKFCQKLGFKGYPDLNYDVSAAMARAGNGDDSNPQAGTEASAVGGVAGDLWLLTSQPVEEMRSINPPRAIEAVAQAIAG